MMLRPLGLDSTMEFFRYKFDEELELYLIVEDILKYLTKASEYPGPADFLISEFFSIFGYFCSKLYFIISQVFKEIKIYFYISRSASYHLELSWFAFFVNLIERSQIKC